MPTAEEVAGMLAYEFLKRGNYAASAGPVQMPELAGVAPAAARHESEEFLTATEAFGGLAVQSVGCEEGVDDPKVYIYLTRWPPDEIALVNARVEPGADRVVFDILRCLDVRAVGSLEICHYLERVHPTLR
jgi:hypothetical protein